MFNDWRFFAIGSAVFAALTAILGKVGVSSINSNYATFIRTLVILGFTATVLSFRGEWTLPTTLDRRGFLFLLFSGIATGASWLFYYRALQLGPASKVAPVDKLSVALTIFLAVIFLGESLNLKTVVGGLFIVIGSIVLLI